jgi:hypothetical protein
MPPEVDDITDTTDDSVSDSESDFIDDGYFSFGTIVRVAGDTFVMREYDFATDTDVEQPYQVTHGTEYGNVLHLAHLRPGDSVVIDYLIDGETRRVETLVKEHQDIDKDDDLPPDQ